MRRAIDAVKLTAVHRQREVEPLGGEGRPAALSGPVKSPVVTLPPKGHQPAPPPVPDAKPPLPANAPESSPPPVPDALAPRPVDALPALPSSPPLTNSSWVRIREGGLGLGLTLVAFFLGILGAVVGASVGAALAGISVGDLSRMKSYPPTLLASTLLGQWIGWLALPFAFSYSGERGGPFRFFGLRFHTVDLLIGLLVGLLAQVTLSYVPSLFLSSAEQARAQSVSRGLAGGGTSTIGRAVVAVCIGVLTPVAEELLFRGMLFGSLRRLVSSRFTWVAIVLGGLFFGFAHFESWLPQGGKVALTGLLSLSLFGAVLCWMTASTKRLGPAIITHMAFNGSAVATLFLSVG